MEHLMNHDLYRIPTQSDCLLQLLHPAYKCISNVAFVDAIYCACELLNNLIIHNFNDGFIPLPSSLLLCYKIRTHLWI